MIIAVIIPRSTAIKIKTADVCMRVCVRVCMFSHDRGWGGDHETVRPLIALMSAAVLLLCADPYALGGGGWIVIVPVL